MQFVAFFVLFVVTASIRIEFDTELNENWNEFKKAYGKNYTASEEIRKRSIWEKAVTEITLHNLHYDLGLHSYRMGLNEHSDMEHEEFVRTFFGNPKQPPRYNYNPIWYPPANIWVPKHVDWREAGIVTPAKHQGCGDCWIFASVGALESMHARNTGHLVDLSEQNVFDCEKNNPCEGGNPQQAFGYVILNRGIDTEVSYPYTAKKGKCRYSIWNVGARAAFYYTIRKGNEEDLKIAVALIGPVVVAIDANYTSFGQYKDGIYDNPNCYNNANHNVLLVGYGTENGKDYWLIKNSWGTSFGVNGYIKMSRNKNNQCFIADYGVFPVPDRFDF